MQNDENQPTADGYYNEDDMNKEDLDLSFLDNDNEKK